MDCIKISHPVGIGEANKRSDVITVQKLLNDVYRKHPLLIVDGVVGPKTVQRIKDFQLHHVGLRQPDGIVDVNGKTIRALHFKKSNYTASNKIHLKENATEQELFIEAAHILGCEAAAVKAVASTETKSSAFFASGKPAILFERHVFSRLTGSIYDDKHPDLSSTTPYKTKGHGPDYYGGHAEQYSKLDRARMLNDVAALESASWGEFQIMGENFSACGFSSVYAFVNAMNTIQGQFSAFVNLIKSDHVLLNALKNKTWVTFARRYNGKNFTINHYDAKMANYYHQYSS
ncbi:N-acetylmuramidase domain-containing protein [Mangrovibacter yixingensis]|uniref:N-acetylmuramidase domain-containing protein n=1 Tax=Mangrovibacter yixingensis TaxID=1529639 RepID=UPI001CFE0A00|nr:N-acetylmuramidase family protein [Mangrovibacter yixingensis]